MRSAIASNWTRRVLAFVVAAALLATWLGCAGGLADLAAHFGPALLLLGVLALGFYPGEVAVARLRRRASARRGRRAHHRSARCRATQRVVAFRTRLLAYHLAVRPPPAGGSAA